MMPSSVRQINHPLLPWIVWGLGCLFYFYEFLLQVSPSVMGNELMKDFAITSQTLGILSGIYYYSYSPMQLPCGILMDKFGPHRVLTFATSICALSTLAFSMTNHIYVAYLARFMIGFGSAFAVVGILKLAANWFKPERFVLLTGLMVTMGMLGAIGGQTPLALLVDAYGWRHSMMIMGSLGLILAVLIFMIAQDKPENAQKFHIPEEDKQAPLFQSLIQILRNKQLWLVAIYGGLVYMPTIVFCGLWGVPFLMFKMHISKALAANYISLVFIGWAIASPLWGIYSNRIGQRKPPLYFAALGSLLTTSLFIYAPLKPGLTIQIILFAFGLFSAGFLCAFSVAKELCDRHYVATGIGFMNMLNMIPAALAQPLIGFILDALWVGDLVNDNRVYPLEAYYIGFAIIPMAIVIATLILPFVRETHCHAVETSR